MLSFVTAAPLRPVHAAASCYLGPHGDVICPEDPKRPGPRDPGDIGDPPWTPPPLPPADPIPGLGTCEGQNPVDVFREHARAREGYSLRVYLDSLGNPTVGIGHLVVPGDRLKVGDIITEERAMAFWEEDSREAFNAALKQAKEAGICDPCFIAALASVDYQLGTGWRAKFPTVWALIEAGRYEEAAAMLDTSLWMEQTPVRVRDFQAALRALPPKPPSCNISGGVPGHPVDPAPTCSTIGWLSGAFEPRPGFEALRSNNPAKSNICTVFSKSATDWAGLLDASGGTIDNWLSQGCSNLIVSFRTLPMGTMFSADNCSSNYRRIADGEFDDYYIRMATDLKNAGVPANAVFRIGWELNSDYPWGLLGCRTTADAQTYIAGHRHIVDILRMYFGDQFTVSWNFLKRSGQLALPIDSYYPGDDYVDYINIDYYDNRAGGPTKAGYEAFANQGSTTVPLGINTWLAYAQSKGKKIGFDEWAIVPSERGGLNDNPTYIEFMYEWFQMHSCQLGYESYFNGASRGHALDTGEHPASSAKYTELWGRSEATPLKPPCSCTPITTPPPPPACGGGPSGPAVLPATGPMMADSAADVVGVNTHINYLDTVYGSHYNDIIKPRLLELGVRHIRDNVGGGVVPGRYRELASSGIRLLLVNMKPEDHDFAKSLGATVVEAVEPPNESDNASLMGPAGDMPAFMREMYPKYKNDPATASMTVLGPSFARTNSSAVAFAGRFPDAGNFMDAGNLHDYPGGTYPEGPGGGGWGISMQEAINRYATLSGGKPAWSTETGYKMSGSVPGHPAVSQRTAAKYMPREFLMHMKYGVPRVYPYQLINNREDFGLLNDDGSPRLQFTAMKNFIAMFEDAGPAFTPGTLDYTLTGNTANIQQMVFQKRDGRFFLVVWQGVDSTNDAPARALTLNLTTNVTTAIQYEPTFSMTPINTLTNPAGIRTLNLNVKDQILVVELSTKDCPTCAITPGDPATGGPSCVPPPAQCTGTGTPVEVSSAGQFQSVLSSAAPGTTIMLLPGNYGTLNVNRGGSSADQPIYIAAKYPAVDVYAKSLATEAQRSNVSLITMNASNVTLCGIFFDDKSLKSIRHDSKVDNATYLQNYFNTQTASSMTVEESIDTFEGGNNLTVQSNYFNGTRNAGFALDYGLALFDYNGVYVRNNVFDGVYNHQLSLKQRNQNVLIDSNTFKGCGQQCLEIGQQPDNSKDGDWTGGAVTVTNNTFIPAYTDHPQGRSTKALVLRNHENITVKGNTFQGRFGETIQTNFINSGGLDRLADRVLGVWGKQATSVLIEGNTFTDGLLHFVGRGIGPKNGGTDTITVRGNTGPFICRIGPFEYAAGKIYDRSTIDESAPTVTGCP